MTGDLEAVQARLEQALRQLEQQRTWRLEAERELAAAKRELEELRGQLFAARDKIASLERAREWASGEIGRRASEPVDIRVRVEPTEARRSLGAINGVDLAGLGWLVLACDGVHVLEVRMLPDEWAKDAANRFDGAASTTAHAMLLEEVSGLAPASEASR